MTGVEQVGAPVLRFGKEPLAPGESARAVIIPLAPPSMDLWRQVKVGDDLRMFEGPQICGCGIVRWISEIERPIPDFDDKRFVDWADGLAEQP